MACNNQSSLFGSSDKYIKFLNGDVVAIEGVNTIDRQILNDLRIPYTQLLRGRVVLKAGQVNYLLNHLGLGDNATFLSIAARYDVNSKIEEDNYINFNYYPDLTKTYYMDQLMILTGNSTHRIPQLYLTNPNMTYSVTLDVMVAVIDDTYNFFTDNTNQTGTTFFGLSHSDINTYVPDQSIIILDTDRVPLAYISLTSISSVEKNGVIISIHEANIGKIFLEFNNEYEAAQSNSLLNYLLNNLGQGIVIDGNHPFEDINPPVVYFNLNVGATASGATISMTGATFSGPYDTSMGLSFSTSISLGMSTALLKSDLNSLLISNVDDNIDGQVTLDDSMIILYDSNSAIVNSIQSVGTYSMCFNIMDLAENPVVSNTNILLNITL